MWWFRVWISTLDSLGSDSSSLLIVWSQTTYLASLCLSFPSHKVAGDISNCLTKLQWVQNELMYAKPTCRPSARLEMRVRRPTPACGMQVRVCARAKSLPLCLTLCDPMDCSLPGSSVHGILQARKLEWVAIPSSSGSSQPRDGSHDSFLSCIGRRVLYHYRLLGSPVRRNTRG